MNLINLDTFLAIVETGSLVKASKRLNVTQSTVTARLQTLEEELGQALVVRQKSGTTLTTAGERFRRYASTITDLWRQAKQETSLPDGVFIVCNIGCHTDLWSGLGEDFFELIQSKHSGAALSIWLGSQSEIDSWIKSGLIDISISFMPNAQGSQLVYQFGIDELVLVSSDKNSLGRSDPSYIYIESGDEFGREHATTFANADSARLSFGTVELGLKHILKNGGTGYLPLRISRPFIDQSKLFVLKDAPVFERKIYLVANKKIADELKLDNVTMQLQSR